MNGIHTNIKDKFNKELMMKQKKSLKYIAQISKKETLKFPILVIINLKKCVVEKLI